MLKEIAFAWRRAELASDFQNISIIVTELDTLRMFGIFRFLLAENASQILETIFIPMLIADQAARTNTDAVCELLQLFADIPMRNEDRSTANRSPFSGSSCHISQAVLPIANSFSIDMHHLLNYIAPTAVVQLCLKCLNIEPETLAVCPVELGCIDLLQRLLGNFPLHSLTGELPEIIFLLLTSPKILW